MTWWILIGLALAFCAAPFAAEAMRPRLDAKKHEKAPGEFADLSLGRTHYRWYGPQDGPVAVCIHGLTTPSFVWDPIAKGLVDQGYRVLTYDLYGRGFSDRPKGDQDSAFFCSQLEELLETQKVLIPFTLLGYSMGGAIAPAFAARHPHQIKQLILLAPGGLGHDMGPAVQLAINHNWIGRWLTLTFYPRTLRRALDTERHLPSEIEGMVDLQIAETRLRGFTPAVLSSLRGIMDEDLEETHRTISKEGIPVLAIWAHEDEIIPITGMGKLAEWNRTARHRVVEDAEHAVAYTHSAAILNEIKSLPNDPSCS